MKNIVLRVVVAVVFLGVVLGGSRLAFSANIPTKINYHGYLKSEGAQFSGAGHFKFAITNDPDSPTVNYWISDGSAPAAGAQPSKAVTVDVKNGVFNVVLGDTRITNMTAIPTSAFSEKPAAYLRVWFSDGSGFEQLSPDTQLVAVPYAYYAVEAESVGGLKRADIESMTEKKDSEVTLTEHNVTELKDVSSAGSGQIISADERSKLTEAHGWGNHANGGYLKSGIAGIQTLTAHSVTELNDVSSAGSGQIIAADERSKLTEVYGWGDHADAGYLKSEDPLFIKDGKVGIGTDSPAAKLNVEGTLQVGSQGSPHNVLFYGKAMSSNFKGKLDWNTDKNAFRAGMERDDYWSGDNVGEASVAFGHGTKASGSWSLAAGNTNTASGDYSVALGLQTTASGTYAMAVGRETVAEGTFAFASGVNSQATGYSSIAMGFSAVASGSNAIALGQAQATGDKSLAVGMNSVASGIYSTAIGGSCQATEQFAVALGAATIASGQAAMAMGNTFENNVDYSLGIGDSSLDILLAANDNSYINNDKNFGIGTNDPQYKLDVHGDINTTGDILKSGVAYNHPDYVFEPGYQLLSLAGLRTFIDENKHLPGVPSAKEVQDKGVKMFEQGRLTLEKLEEAYLYIFQLEKRIAELEKKLAE